MERHLRSAAAPALVLLLGLAFGACSTDAGTSAATSGPSGVPRSAGPSHLTEEGAKSLTPGAYQLSFATVSDEVTPDAVVEVPNGFSGGASWYVVSHDGHQFLGLFNVGPVTRDACPGSAIRSFYPGPSVQDLADALVAQQSTRATKPSPVTVAGHDGLYVQLASPADTSRCKETGSLWSGRGIYSDGQVDRVWILDVDGQRLVLDAAFSRADSTAADVKKLTAMVDSIRFVPSAQG